MCAPANQDHEEKKAAASQQATTLQSTLSEVQDTLVQSKAVANQYREEADSWRKAHEKLSEDFTTMKTRCRSAELQLQESPLVPE